MESGQEMKATLEALNSATTTEDQKATQEASAPSPWSLYNLLPSFPFFGTTTPRSLTEEEQKLKADQQAQRQAAEAVVAGVQAAEESDSDNGNDDVVIVHPHLPETKIAQDTPPMLPVEAAPIVPGATPQSSQQETAVGPTTWSDFFWGSTPTPSAVQPPPVLEQAMRVDAEAAGEPEQPHPGEVLPLNNAIAQVLAENMNESTQNPPTDTKETADQSAINSDTDTDVEATQPNTDTTNTDDEPESTQVDPAIQLAQQQLALEAERLRIQADLQARRHQLQLDQQAQQGRLLLQQQLENSRKRLREQEEQERAAAAALAEHRRLQALEVYRIGF